MQINSARNVHRWHLESIADSVVICLEFAFLRHNRAPSSGGAVLDACPAEFLQREMHVPGLPQFLSDTLTGSCFPLVINFAVPGRGSSRDVGVTLGEPSVHIGRHLLSSEHRAVFIRSASGDRLRTSRVVRGPQGTFAFRLAPRLNSLIFFFLSRLTFQFFFSFLKVTCQWPKSSKSQT